MKDITPGILTWGHLYEEVRGVACEWVQMIEVYKKNTKLPSLGVQHILLIIIAKDHTSPYVTSTNQGIMIQVLQLVEEVS